MGIHDDLDQQTGPRDQARFLHGTDLGLQALAPIDLGDVDGFAGLLEAMKRTSFGGRQLGEAADVLVDMITDPDCLVVGTFSGAMTVAKQGLVLWEMIDRGWLNVVVSTGALMAHGLVEATGMTHFRAPPDLTDRQMFYAGFDRVYDTLELEKNLDDLEAIVDALLDELPDGAVVSSWRLDEILGRYLLRATEERSILGAAARRGVPVYVPAFSDSELGLDFALHNRKRAEEGRGAVRFDPFDDLEDYARRCDQAERMGIFTIGGGVPRNWAQQVAPYLDIVATRMGQVGRTQRFRYGVRVCPEPVHWGGLSGCTYKEGVSWGKFVPPSEGGRFAEVPADATLVWPLLVAGVIERLDALGWSRPDPGRLAEPEVQRHAQLRGAPGPS